MSPPPADERPESQKSSSWAAALVLPRQRPVSQPAACAWYTARLRRCPLPSHHTHHGCPAAPVPSTAQDSTRGGGPTRDTTGAVVRPEPEPASHPRTAGPLGGSGARAPSSLPSWTVSVWASGLWGCPQGHRAPALRGVCGRLPRSVSALPPPPLCSGHSVLPCRGSASWLHHAAPSCATALLPCCWVMVRRPPVLGFSPCCSSPPPPRSSLASEAGKRPGRIRWWSPFRGPWH